MIPFEIALIVFASVFSGTLIGMILRVITPEHHLSHDAKEVIKLGMGLIATMAALVLGLVIATAKSSYDSQEAALKHTSAKILLLDRMLADFGSETKETRQGIRRIVVDRLDTIWPEERSQHGGGPHVPEKSPSFQEIVSGIRQLSPQNNAQQWLQSRALEVSNDIMETRWLIWSTLGSSVPLPFLVVVVFWLTIIFSIFGLLASRNPTVIVVLIVCAVSVSGAIFLILEMDQPFHGFMKIASTPLRYALSELGQ